MTSTDGSALTLVAELDDSAVLARLSMLAARSRRAEADVLIVLAEVDARGLYVAAGYSSLFDFVSRSLGYSEAGAYNRIGAARAIRAFPQALAYVTSGRLHLSGLTLIGRVATRETVDELLELCAGHSKREIEARLVQFADARKPVEPAPTEAALPLLDFAAVGTVADAAHDAPSPVLPRSPAPAAPPPASGATNRPVVMRPLQVRMTPKLQSLLQRGWRATLRQLGHVRIGVALRCVAGFLLVLDAAVYEQLRRKVA